MGNLYTRMKIFHFKEKVDSLPRNVPSILPPVHIRIKPTNACCHNCRYCAYRADSLQLGKDMVVRDFIPREKMLEIADDIVEMGVKAVTFSGGGDPFCYPYLLETVQRLDKGGVKFAALTNGSRLNGETAEFFAKRARWIRISMDGWDSGSYATYRGVGPDEFARVIGNINSFKKRGTTCYTGISIIADRDNAAHIYDLIKMLKGIGVDSVKISPCIVSDSGRENDEYHAPVFDLIKREIARAESEFKSGDFEIFDSYHKQLEAFAKTYTWCPYQQILPVIAADQNVYPCQDKAYNLESGLLGSLKHQRFKDFWFSDKNIFFKINPSRDCNHHCVSHERNKLLLEYLDADEGHLEFV